MRTFESHSLALALLLVAGMTARAATNVVTSTADSGAGSLRSAVAGASTGDTIVFHPSLSGQRIVLTTGEIVLSNSVTIDGSGVAGGMVISGNGQSRIFFVDSFLAPVVLNSLIISNGWSPGQGGGGVRNQGTLTVNQCTFINNTNGPSGNGGGGICNARTLVVNHCMFTGNRAISTYGGGIWNIGPNASNGGTVTVNNSTFVGNNASNGGGINNYQGTMAVNNCTFTANHSGAGGGIYSYGDIFDVTLTVNNCTIVGNSASGGSGAGIRYGSSASYRVGTLNLTNSIVCSNAPGTGNVYKHPWMESGIYRPANNLIDANALVAPLGNYGGVTQTMPPLPGSPAINTGNDSVTNSFDTDQRGSGYVRRSGVHVDIGAVEFLPSTNAPTLTDAKRLSNGAFQFRFTYQMSAGVTVFASTNANWPINAWSNLGAAVENPADSGGYLFTDLQATNHSRRFYRVHSP